MDKLTEMDSEINHEDVEDVEDEEDEEDVENQVEIVETTEEETPTMFSSPWHFSDVVLVVEGTKFHVHKCILSIWSPVFEKMFTSEFAEKNAEEIPLPEKRKMEMEQLLKVIYSAEAKQEVTETNYEFLLELAREYQMDKVQEYCTQYMGQDIDDQNCLHRYKIAENFGLEDVMEKCNKEALFKLSTDLEDSDDFLELGFESKFRLCMARLKELEKALGMYADICTKLVCGYYKNIGDRYDALTKHVQCINKVSHNYKLLYSYWVGENAAKKDFDSSCRFCRNRISSYKNTIGAVNAMEFDDLFIKLYDLEHYDKIRARIIARMKAFAWT